ncbi:MULTISPECIES: ABC transporter permease [Kitasatospora]|uniref:Putative membrane protein n=1 Tax=Kitasatospora setae (strain ATCC 33774 / DSM 43861 / JCM 3304 / KCC A-0304 / NBRC 14216 / KM-6054) TaxID=452652 RepID=E4NG69_KITSK|nr:MULTISPECIES: ABC transporter permease [Kitasatospora]BAJ30499.1 putative membrane protein [Kitasatospora setae KM-6054]
MYRTALRNVLAHKGRLLMTVLAVLLGTAFVAGTLVFSDTMGQAMRNSYSTSYSDVSVLVSADGPDDGPADRDAPRPEKGALTQETVQRLAALPGTERARGVVSGFTGVADKNGNLIGESWSARGVNFVPDASGADSRYPMADGRGPRTAGEVALNRQAADKAGYRVGDTVRVAGNGAARDAVLTGVFTTDDPQVTSGGTLVLMDTATAQRELLEPGRFSSVVLTAKAGTGEQALLEQARAAAPADGVELKSGQQLKDDQVKMVDDSVSTTKTMLLVFAGISLFVGIFIIVNTFTMLIAQRLKELALLRAVGASRGQVTKSVLVEALAIGVIASVGGLLAGIGIGAGLQSLLHAFNEGMPTGALVVAPTTVVATLVTGVVVTVLSALLPAVRASRIPPVAAMSSGEQPSTQRGLVIRNTIGVLIAGAGLGLILAGANGKGSGAQHLLELGAPLALIGVFVLLPLLSRPVIALVGPVLAKVFGTPGKLARLNAVRNPRRTASTAAALTIGLTLVTALTVIGNSVTSAVTSMVAGTMKADYVVGMANHRELAPELTGLVAKAPGVKAVSQVDNVWWQFEGSDKAKAIEGYDAAAFDQLVNLKMTEGATSALQQDRILVNDEFATSHHLSAGSTVRATAPGGEAVTLTVGGVFERNDGVSPVVASNRLIEAHDKSPLVQQILVKGADGATPALKQAVKDATGRNPVIEVRTTQDMVNEFNRIISTMLNLMYGLLGMAVIVAVLGVINTLAMSVFERKREIGMLRAIGLERRGIKRMIRLESVVISLFGAAVGVLLGCFLAWAATRLLASDLKGLTTVIPYGSVLLFLGLAALVGMVAALWPARRASRMDILSSIKTD